MLHSESLLLVVGSFMVYINPLLSTSGLTSTQLGVTALAAHIASTIARLVIGPIADGTKHRHVVFFLLSLTTAMFILSFFAFPRMTEYVFEGKVHENGVFVPHVVWSSNGTESNYSNKYSSQQICWPQFIEHCNVMSNGKRESKFKLGFRLQKNDTNPMDVKYIVTNGTLRTHDVTTNASENFRLFCRYTHPVEEEACHKLRNTVKGVATVSIFLMAIVLRSFVTMTHSSIPNLLDSTTYGILKEEKAHMYGRSRAFGSAGYVAAALSTGLYISSISNQFTPSSAQPSPGFASIQHSEENVVDYKPTIILGSIFAFLGAIVGGIPSSGIKPVTINLRKAILIGIRSPAMIKCSINSFLSGLVYSYLFEFYFFVLTSEYNVPPYFIGFLVLSVMIGEVPAFFVAGSLVKRFGETACIAAAHILFGLRVLSFGVFSNYLCYIGSEILFTTGFSLLYTALIIQAGSAGRGVQAEAGDVVASMHALMNAILFSITSCIGGPIWGALLDRFTGRQLFYAASVSSFVLAVFTPIISYFIDLCFCDPKENDILVEPTDAVKFEADKNGFNGASFM
ncbi:hypothetical protein CSKR_104150 [Clonorchis sinensis]|uniref:Major facilitator superfamily associated domain-containing protein n=1 Tax=Clonorchis sinensis TaxID=79923 RepID=A0A3R7C0S5_CLOSI|nr:hypothetical protein CSKR_104150 [Clonorchis sinensis]